MPFRPFLLFPALLLLSASAPAIEPPKPASPWKLTPVSAAQKLTALAPGQLEPFRAAPVQVAGARGEHVGFQFVVTAGARAIETIQITRNGLASAEGDFLPAKNLEIYRENYVFVPVPSGNRDLTPKWWPDALLPLDLAPRGLAANQSAAFWGALHIPQGAAPGEYYGELDFVCDGAPRRLALTVVVENRTLPAPQIRGTVAVYYDVLRDWYRKSGNEFSDAEWREQKRRYYDFLLLYGLNAYDLPVAWDDPEAERYLRDPRVLSVRTPEVGAPDFDLALQLLRATNTLPKAFYYRIDEPTTDAEFARAREIAPRLQALGIRHLVTAHPNFALQNAVDIWCPNIGDFFGINHLSAPALLSERKRGRETWFYTMVEPKFPDPTWLLDDDAASIAAFGPLMARYGFSGFVYSMAHGWGPKPLENLTSFAGTSGDGTLIYPAEIVGGVGPMPSIRLMLLRDMIEDVTLNRAKPKPEAKPAALSLPVQVALRREGVPATSVSARFEAKTRELVVTFRASKPQEGDWVAVEISPADIEQTPEKWRFVATRKGALRTQKWTREGRFEPDQSALKSRVREEEGATLTEMRIPLAILGDAKTLRFDALRFDALRRTTVSGAKITAYAFSGGDPALMPLLRLK